MEMINVFNTQQLLRYIIKKIKWNPETVSNIKPFKNKYNWEKINYPSKIDDWKKLEKIIQKLLLIFCILKKNTFCLYFKS